VLVRELPRLVTVVGFEHGVAARAQVSCEKGNGARLVIGDEDYVFVVVGHPRLP
jgi:hypothetical protein